MTPFDARDAQAVAALRVLAVDQVEQARSGHPGLPLGAAPMAYVLWSRFLRHDPGDPAWPDRDRFVLSAGHGSALLYALLHLFGYDLPLDELKRFRQWGSRTPGHPERGLTPGVEVTAGPLGQGLTAAVGMALAERHLAQRFNRDGFELVNHRTWVIASDGDLMEGISHEAAALAGHLRLGRLAVLWDDNHITIEGPTSLAFSEDVAARFGAYGWRVVHVEDGNDLGALAGALAEAVQREDVPVLIRVRTHIGFGSPKQDSAAAHGSPLGRDAAAATRKNLGWAITDPFTVPDEVYRHVRAANPARARERLAWHELVQRYGAAEPASAAELARRLRGDLPPGWDQGVPGFEGVASIATREASGQVLNAIAARVPELLGGSADLAPSNNTLLAGEADIAAGAWGGRNLHFGVREHAMAAVASGLTLHGGVRPFVATFLVFSDYLRPALRLAAMQRLPVIYVFTHDSLAVGEDGPTHQPVEQLVSLRLIPNLVVLRPADAHETADAWRVALMRREGPTAILLTRQKLPVQALPPAGAVARGAFVSAEAGGGVPEVVMIATGSEVALALAARSTLEAAGVPTRVVSAPSLELLARQEEAYQRQVLGPGHALRVALEMGRGQGWHRWVGNGETIALSRFGVSAPAEEVTRRLGFSVEAVVARVQARLARRRHATATVQLPEPLRARGERVRATLHERRLCAHLLARDSALWGVQHVASASRRLGWLDLPARTLLELPSLERLVADLVGDGCQRLYLLGMGGSSLAPEVLRRSEGSPSGRELIVVDTTDPGRVLGLLDGLDAAGAAVLAVSKSGTTAETLALLEAFWQALRKALGARAATRVAVLTEPGTALERLAHERGHHVLHHPVDVGGRFSALSAVGMLPALWLGLDVEEMLAGAEAALRDLGDRHPAVELAIGLATAAEEGWGKLAWASSPAFACLGPWAEQLVAESTGKGGRGILPVAIAQIEHARPWPGTLFLSPRLIAEEVAELDAGLDGLAERGAPVLRWPLAGTHPGEAFMTLELATALTSALLGVNPFDEPDVVAAKDGARAALSGGALAMPPPTADAAAVLRRGLAGIALDEAVALLAYLPERSEVAWALAELAAALGETLGVPVTAAFGPRYLHSTGQLHKGGPPKLRTVILIAPPARDLAIPGQSHTFGQLRLAQALGDREALLHAGRTVVQLALGPDPTRELTQLRDTFRS
jgi:transketolase